MPEIKFVDEKKIMQMYIFNIDDKILRFKYKDYCKEESLGEDVKEVS